MSGQHARPRFNWARYWVTCTIACGLFLAGVVAYEVWRIITS